MLKIWTDDNQTKISLPVPADFEFSFSDIDKDSGRNDLGLMQRNRLGSKRKLTIAWNPLKDPEAHRQMIALLKSLPPFFYCQYPDPDGSNKSMECYRGDIKTNMFRYDAESGNLWKEMTCNFIER